MRQDVKDAWVAWLENPEHEQCTQKLHSDDKFCVLGALVDVAIEMGLDLEWDSRLADCVKLPPKVAIWAQLDSLDPEVVINGFDVNLSEANDTYHKTFPELAILIKESL